jgi:hypothetical protein
MSRRLTALWADTTPKETPMTMTEIELAEFNLGLELSHAMLAAKTAGVDAASIDAYLSRRLSPAPMAAAQAALFA